MAQTRFTCTLTRADEPACQSYARVTIVDAAGAAARGCPRHAVAALDGITGAHVDWTDSRGLNGWERTALELSEERSKLAYGTSTIRGPRVTNGSTAQTEDSSPQTERLWYPSGTQASHYQKHPASGQGDHVSARWVSRLEGRTLRVEWAPLREGDGRGYRR